MKRFIIKTLLYAIPILIPLIGFGIFIYPHLSGDIGPLGYITFDDNYAQMKEITDNKVINCKYGYKFTNNSSILTIGDSFSQTNKRYISYNYYLAKSTDKVVYNLQPWDVNPFLRFLYVSKTQELPKIVIVESVERYFIERLCQLNVSLSASSMSSRHLIDTTYEYKSSSKTLLESTQEWVKREMNLKGYENPIKSVKLSQSYFSCKDRENELHFYVDDIKITELTDSVANIATEKLDSLFKYADSIGIELYVLIAADKYEVYQNYIVDNPYPPKTLLTKFMDLYNHPHLINSRDTLYRLVEKGVQDIYWANNTHWGIIGSKAVAEQVLQHIEQ